MFGREEKIIMSNEIPIDKENEVKKEILALIGQSTHPFNKYFVKLSEDIRKNNKANLKFKF
jgi:hypothetical protein